MNGIEYPKYKYRYGEKMFPTTKIDENKITKRIVYGDEYFGKPERNMYGKKAYNGNSVDGVIDKLSGNWLDDKAQSWKRYIDSHKDERGRIYKLYVEYVRWKKGKSSIYRPLLDDNQRIFSIYLRYLKDFGIPDTLKLECITETFNEKFGVEPVSDEIYEKSIEVTFSL